MTKSENSTSHDHRAIPASGAWQPGDKPGCRKFFDFEPDRWFVLECGLPLKEVTVSYETWGDLNEDHSNAILICHALTGDSHAAGDIGEGHPTPGWWRDLIGSGKAIDTDRYFVVCPNVLGGCQGTTGPASINPETNTHYGASFPPVTIRDMVRTQEKLTNHLGIERWHSIIGGSMGGMQVLEWAVMFPERVRSAIPIATSKAASQWQIAFSAIGRRAITVDTRWNRGNYYGAPDGEGPHRGLSNARAVGMVTYRTEKVLEISFAPDLVNPFNGKGSSRFQIENYLQYQGEKLARRFDANSYIILNNAMDSHDLSRGRRRPDGSSQVFSRIQAPTLCLSVDSDILYPSRQQQELVEEITKAGNQAVALVEIKSDFGHDGFLLEPEQVGEAISGFLSSVGSETDQN